MVPGSTQSTPAPARDGASSANGRASLFFYTEMLNPYTGFTTNGCAATLVSNDARVRQSVSGEQQAGDRSVTNV